MACLEALEFGGTLRLVNSFEPEPLYTVLEQRGNAHNTSSSSTTTISANPIRKAAVAASA